ncbi:hypothetical protein GF402_07235 [Candidatus Fermentibacteria bacterium]|nr:hypothetical protein [Candidatus Fermentibacteria bacterium]
MERSVDLLTAEARDRSWDYWPRYRLAWALNRLELPDSALGYARSALRLSPQNQWCLGEVMRALYHLQRYDDVLACSSLIRGGGVCRYYLARVEEITGTSRGRSLGYLSETVRLGPDSAAADASSWLAVLLAGKLESDSLVGLLRLAVDLQPDVEFYRCRLAEELARAGRVDEAVMPLLPLRIDNCKSTGYWQAWAAIAEAQEDRERQLWALQRAWESRRVPSTARNLGWGLYVVARERVREGELEEARGLLLRCSAMSDSSEVFVRKADSLLELFDEYEKAVTAAGG